MTDDELVAWARDEAQRLKASSLHALAPTLDFLRRQGAGGDFYKQAQTIANKDSVGAETTNRWVRAYLAELLLSWANFVEAGLATALPFEAHARIEAASDLMEQVQLLLDDRAFHVAAPVVLAGAALEEFLRSLMVGCSEPVAGKPTLSTYAAALRKGGLINKADEKDITSWAAQRNEAAHGQFDDLTHARAKLMAEGINLFISRKSPRQNGS